METTARHIHTRPARFDAPVTLITLPVVRPTPNRVRAMFTFAGAAFARAVAAAPSDPAAAPAAPAAAGTKAAAAPAVRAALPVELERRPRRRAAAAARERAGLVGPLRSGKR